MWKMKRYKVNQKNNGGTSCLRWSPSRAIENVAAITEAISFRLRRFNETNITVIAPAGPGFGVAGVRWRLHHVYRLSAMNEMTRRCVFLCL
jgi:hypothetical protein